MRADEQIIVMADRVPDLLLTQAVRPLLEATAIALSRAGHALLLSPVALALQHVVERGVFEDLGRPEDLRGARALLRWKAGFDGCDPLRRVVRPETLGHRL